MHIVLIDNSLYTGVVHFPELLKMHVTLYNLHIAKNDILFSVLLKHAGNKVIVPQVGPYDFQQCGKRVIQA